MPAGLAQRLQGHKSCQPKPAALALALQEQGACHVSRETRKKGVGRSPPHGMWCDCVVFWRVSDLGEYLA